MSWIVNWWLMWAQIITTHPIRLIVLILRDSEKAVAETKREMRSAYQAANESLLSLVITQMAISEIYKEPTP